MKLAALLLIGVAFAGCAGDEGTDKAPDEAVEAPISLPAPTWAVGDWWTFTTGTLGDVTWVVTEDGGANWIMDVNSEDLAFAHAAFGEISTIGEISKAQLAGSQETGPVNFFDFPLTMNKTWQITWDQRDWEATVVDMTETTAEVQATNMDGDLRVYIYNNDTKWFNGVAAYDMNGTEEFRFSIKDSGSNYSGDYVRWDILDRIEFTVGAGSNRVDSFDVAEEATDIWASITAICAPGGLAGGSGAGLLEFHPQDDANAGFSYQDVCPVDYDDQLTLEPHPGSWGLTAASVGAKYDVIIMPRALVVAQVAS